MFVEQEKTWTPFLALLLGQKMRLQQKGDDVFQLYLVKRADVPFEQSAPLRSFLTESIAHQLHMSITEKQILSGGLGERSPRPFDLELQMQMFGQSRTCGLFLGLVRVSFIHVAEPAIRNKGSIKFKFYGNGEIVQAQGKSHHLNLRSPFPFSCK